MSGAMRRIGEYLGLLEDTGYDEYDDEPTEQRSTRESREPRQARPVRAVPSSPVADLDERRQFVVGNFEEADFIRLDLSLVEPIDRFPCPGSLPASAASLPFSKGRRIYPVRPLRDLVDS